MGIIGRSLEANRNYSNGYDPALWGLRGSTLNPCAAIQR